MKRITRREAIKTALAGGAVLATTGLSASVSQSGTMQQTPLKGNIRHSVSKWCF